MRAQAIVREAKTFNRRRFIETAAASALLATVSPFATAASKKIFSIGVAKRRVTPPLWVPYLTSSNNGTNAPFQSFHDDLFARALVLENGSQRLAILSVDSIGYDNSVLGPRRDFTREFRRLVARQTGLSPGAIMLAATHAHSVPETIGLTPFRDSPRVRDWLEDHLHELVATVVEAWTHRSPGRAFFGSTHVEGIARNRRILLRNGKLSVYGPVPPPEQVATPWQLDETLSLLCFEDLSGELRALLMNYTAHPVVAMLLPAICADYPGFACTAIEAELPTTVCLFTNGAAGNINSIKVSTNFDDVATLGRRLADAALAKTRELRAGPPLADTTLEVHSREITFAPRDCPSLRAALAKAAPDAVSHDGTVTRLAEKLAAGVPRGEIQAMRLGPVRWISIPGEPFVETGLALKSAGAQFVVGYANGYLGYFPLRHSYGEGGYEVVQGAWSRVAPGSAEQLQARAGSLLRKFG